jgi:hypothetical protein
MILGKNIITIVLVCALLVANKSLMYGQYYEDNTGSNTTTNPSADFKDRLYYGGNLSFNVFNSFLFMDYSPIVGYKITDNLSAGLGGKFMFLRDLRNRFNWTIYGGSVFSRYKLFPTLFAHAEYELLSAYNLNYLSPNYGQRAPASMFFVGGGYANGGGGVGVVIMLLYDVINHPNSPYQNSYLFGFGGPPVILRIGFTVGF